MMIRWMLAGMIVLVGCAAPRRSLTILHTNDIHGHFAPERAAWSQDTAMVGGFSALSGALDSVREADKNTVYLDAGDLMTGNPICNIIESGTKGGALLQMLNFCGCDAIAVGNHEFDLGPDHLREFVATDKVDWLCGNVVDETVEELICPTFKIITRGDLRIGVIGLLLDDLAGVVSKQAIAGFSVQNSAKSAQKAIDEIDAKTDLIILLTHNGVENDMALARSVHGCDLIVGGHSHTRLQEPIVENGVLIVQAGSYLKNLGVLKVNVQNDEITKYSGQLVELETSRFEADSAISAYCAGFGEQIELEYGEVIATAAESMERRYAASSPLGNLLCDLLSNSYHCDIALINSGGIRKDLSTGPIRKLDIVEMLPFANFVNLFEVSGAELKAFARIQAQAQVSQTGDVLQMSGIEIQYHVKDNLPVDIAVLVGGIPVDDSTTYRGISIDYVLRSQADKYLGFKPQNIEETGVLLSDFVIYALHDLPQPVYPKQDVRLIRINE